MPNNKNKSGSSGSKGASLYSMASGKVLKTGSRDYNKLLKKLRDGRVSEEDYINKIVAIRTKAKDKKKHLSADMIRTNMKGLGIHPVRSSEEAGAGGAGAPAGDGSNADDSSISMPLAGAPAGAEDSKTDDSKPASRPQSPKRITIRVPKKKGKKQKQVKASTPVPQVPQQRPAPRDVKNLPMSDTVSKTADPPTGPDSGNRSRAPVERAHRPPRNTDVDDDFEPPQLDGGASNFLPMAGAGGPPPPMPPMPQAPAPAVQNPQAPVGEDQAVKQIAEQDSNVVSKGLQLKLVGRDSDTELRQAKVLYREMIQKLFVSHSFLRLQEICLAKPELKRELEGKPVELIQRTEQLIAQYQDQLLGLKEPMYGVQSDKAVLKKQLTEIYTMAKHIRSSLGKTSKPDILKEFSKVGVIVSASSLGLTLDSLLEWSKKHGAPTNAVDTGLKGFGDEVPDLSELTTNLKEKTSVNVPDGKIKLRLDTVFDHKKEGEKFNEEVEVKKINYREVRMPTVSNLRAKKAHKGVKW